MGLCRFLDRADPLPGRRLPANAERRAFDLAAIQENDSPDRFLIFMAPRVPDLGEPVVDLMLVADPIKDALEGINMPFVIGKLPPPLSLRPMAQHGSSVITTRSRQGKAAIRLREAMRRRPFSRPSGAV